MVCRGGGSAVYVSCVSVAQQLQIAQERQCSYCLYYTCLGAFARLVYELAAAAGAAGASVLSVSCIKPNWAMMP